MKINGETQLATQQKTKSLSEVFMDTARKYGGALPKGKTPEDLTRIAMTAIAKTPKLGTCTHSSFMCALITASQLGLEVNTPLGQAYLIPYNKKNSAPLCNFQLGYQGILDLAYRTGKYKRIKAVVVYEGEEFEFEYGIPGKLWHKPGKPTKPVYVYALYELTNGGSDYEVWTWAKVIEHGKKYSQSYASGPWVTDTEGMAKKTVLLALLKYAPKSIDIATATEADGKSIELKQVFSGNAEDVVPVYEMPDEESEEHEEQPPAAKQDAQPAGKKMRQEPTDEELAAEMAQYQSQNFAPEFDM